MTVPLADRLRPVELSEVVGQKHILGEGKMLRRVIESGRIPNLVFYGPSGVGKTTVASIIAKNSGMYLAKLNGTTASTADIREIFGKLDTLETMNGILLYLDEIQFFNKKQQQTLLEFMEDGRITLIASTTENPYFYIYNAILSRSTVFEFKPIAPEEVQRCVQRAYGILEEELHTKLDLEEGAAAYIAGACGGDVRKALNAVELSVLAGETREGGLRIALADLRQVTQHSAARYDRDGDVHYDLLSAYQKSMRGSDPNAALHYLARILAAGDLPSACRRLLVCACEDVGLAYPQIMPIVKAAVDIANMVGMPEAQLALADAVLLVCHAPKSNSAHNAMGLAMADVQAGLGKGFPRQLQNTHYDGDDVAQKGQFYRYPHDAPGHWLPQQYLPDDLKDRVYYEFGENKTEQSYRQYWERIKGQGVG